MDTTRGAVLSAHGLCRRFQGIQAVDDMSLSLAPGELLGLIGPNGAGKTTMFNMLAGSLPPSAGRIELMGTDVTAEGAEKRLGRGLGRTFQIPRPFPRMSVLENVLCGAQKQSGESVFGATFRIGASRRDEARALEKARHIIDFLLLTHLVDQPASVLSGGQRKLLELARVLMADPRVILLDEPAAGVNPSLLEQIMARIVDLNAQGVSILLIEHNMDMVAQLCSRVVVMALGRELAQGAPAAVIRDPEVVRAYLGDAA
ncbi:ABC transporter ATP-binding protein (plasmid) [Alloyangia pacifica]|uniref:ABC transporter ATP-binding protein n=1 Tax=Alloyangia pacifica TaxID=311180 RepID=A0A2U8HLJ5_9RHOB|nr:ABC transporter ATP-binding protein [Alloyangia pacifica]AWI86642.1 ABC transporter ATP-binding protein [Alloyangia pacifica]